MEGGCVISSASHSNIISCSKFLSDPFVGPNHVLVSDMDVSSIMSLSCMSHSKRKRWKASVCLSALKDGVSRHTFTSSTGCALLSLPSAEVLSIFISAGVLRVFLTLSLISVPGKQDNLIVARTLWIYNLWIGCCILGAGDILVGLIGRNRSTGRELSIASFAVMMLLWYRTYHLHLFLSIVV